MNALYSKGISPSPPPDRGFRISELVCQIIYGMEIVFGIITLLTLFSIAIMPLPLPSIISMASVIAFMILLSAEALTRYQQYLPTALQNVTQMISAIVGEFFAGLLAVLLLPLRISGENARVGELEQEKPLIIFAHGFLHNSSGGWYIRRRVKEKGYPIIATEQNGWLGGIEDYGNQLSDLAEQYRPYIEKHGVIFWGHSMGGIASLYAANKLAANGWKIKVITFGSPLAGSRWANYLACKSAEQMKYPSAFTQTLASELATKNNVSCLHIGSSHDLIIRPVASAIWEKQVNEANVLLPALGHLQMLFSDCAIDVSLKQLQFSHPLDSFNT